MLEYWLWLVMALGAGNPKIWAVLHISKNPKNAYFLLQEEMQRQKFGLTDHQKRAVCSTSLEKVQNVLENCKKKDISVVCFDDEEYPSWLKNIYNPPAVLFYQGHLDILEEYPTVTVVGTRKPTEYSVRVTNRICSDLARAGVVIVSGFAVGIDSA
ncbi:MAG: DNA-processing protein DprA, partial [Ruminococcus sp.]